MEANVFRHNMISTPTLTIKCKPEHRSSVVAVLSFRRPNSDDNNNITGETRKTNVYKDNWFDRLAINHLSKSLQAATGSYIVPFCVVPLLQFIHLKDKFLEFCISFLQDSVIVRVGMRAWLRQLL